MLLNSCYTHFGEVCGRKESQFGLKKEQLSGKLFIQDTWSLTLDHTCHTVDYLLKSQTSVKCLYLFNTPLISLILARAISPVASLSMPAISDIN